MKTRNIYERIRNELRKENETRTQTQIATEAGIKQSSVHRYLSDESQIRAMRLDVFFALFPDADIIFRKPTDIGGQLMTMLKKMTEEEQTRALSILEAAFPHHAG